MDGEAFKEQECKDVVLEWGHTCEVQHFALSDWQYLAPESFIRNEWFRKHIAVFETWRAYYRGFESNAAKRGYECINGGLAWLVCRFLNAVVDQSRSFRSEFLDSKDLKVSRFVTTRWLQNRRQARIGNMHAILSGVLDRKPCCWE
jgi:hypothetical protein